MPTLLTLRDRGYKLGVITDGLAVKQWEKLIRLGLQHFFHVVIISSDVDGGKPDPLLFEKALEKIGCKAVDALMVGDRLDKDIRGAKSVGMVAAQIMKGKYTSMLPADESEEPDYVISALSDILEILEK